jgi:deazaflavin-dependent oxidoreductase (nitroreductase family)
MDKQLIHQNDEPGKSKPIGERWFYRLKQWLYRGQKPNWIAKTINRLQARTAAKNATSNGLIALEVVGRKSGKAISFPLVMVTVSGQRYLVSMLGENVQWVLNVRASGGKAVLCSGGREDIQLEEIPISQRATILKAYLQVAEGARPHVSVHKDAPLVEFEKIAPEYPVFRLTSSRAG